MMDKGITNIKECRTVGVRELKMSCDFVSIFQVNKVYSNPYAYGSIISIRSYSQWISEIKKDTLRINLKGITPEFIAVSMCVFTKRFICPKI